MLLDMFNQMPKSQREILVDTYFSSCVISAAMEAVIDKLSSTIREQYIDSVRTMMSSLDRLNLLVEDVAASLDAIDLDKLAAEFPEHEFPLKDMKRALSIFVAGFDEFKTSFQLAYNDLLELCPTQDITEIDDQKNEYLQRLQYAQRIIEDSSETEDALASVVTMLLDECKDMTAQLAVEYAQVIQSIPGHKTFFSPENGEFAKSWETRVLQHVRDITEVPDESFSYSHARAAFPQAASCQP